MFKFNRDDTPAAKCIIARGILSKYIDPKQIPTKKKPFSTINGQPFSHTVDLVLPAELYDVIWKQIESKIGYLEYSRVIMPLSALLEDEFFNTYIKSGNIAMLSEGRSGVDNVYCLKDGILRLELPKEVYERVGIVGTSVRDGGRKHIKSRYVIEINLRLPAMLHGKKGFERIVWAFKNVLVDAVTWLFHDFDYKSPSSGSNKVQPNLPTNLGRGEPLAQHHPIGKTCEPHLTRTDVLTPPMRLPSADDYEEEQMQVIEWIDLVLMKSPRIDPNDKIDQYLSRYEIPDIESASVIEVVKVSWRGFVMAAWIRELYLQCFWASRGGDHSWFALSAKGLQTEAVDGRQGYTILTMSSNEKGLPHPKVGENTLPVGYAVWEFTSGVYTRS